MGNVFYMFQAGVWLDEKDSLIFWRKIRQLKYNLRKKKKQNKIKNQTHTLYISNCKFVEF